MKKIIKKVLVIIGIALAIGAVAVSGVTLSQNSKLHKEITAITQEKEKTEEELRVCGEESVQKDEKIMALEGQNEAQKEEIEKLKKEITELKKSSS